MGVELISVGSTAPWYSKVSSPVVRGLEGWFNFDTDISRVGFNRAPGKRDGLIVGLPVINSGYVEFTGNSNYLNTAIAETANMTVLIVAKALVTPDGSPAITPATAPMFFGTYQGTPALPGYPTTQGIALYSNRPNIIYGSAAKDDGTGAGVTNPAASISETGQQWALHALRVGDLIPTELFNLTTNVSASRANATIRVPSVNTLRIGGGYSSQFAGKVAISQVVVFSVALTNDEISKVAALMRTRAARLGITV